MFIDQLITTFDTGLKTVFAQARATRAHPDELIEEADMTDQQKQHVVSLMRINHVGEVCAQALYSGQALTSRNTHIVESLQHAAKEETDHLAWCESRIKALGGQKSMLNPLWYIGSFSLGAVAGAIGDKWNLGFLAETEQQVSAHLSTHLEKLPKEDKKSRAIIEQMHADETSHAQEAVNLGAAELPNSIKKVMNISSKIMTTTAYYI